MPRMTDPRMHDPEAKKAMDARLARIEGQVRAVRRMIEEDQACESIAQQLSAARRALDRAFYVVERGWACTETVVGGAGGPLDRAFYEMVSCMIRHEPPGGGSEARSARAGQVAALLARFG